MTRPRDMFLHVTSFAVLAAVMGVATFALPASAADESAPAPTFARDDALSWAFEPARDSFSPDALFDLRSLNERVAGEKGFVRTSPDGGFLLGDGTPVRFWGVNFDFRERLDDAALAHMARFLAKRGVNMVRWHGFLNPKIPKDAPADAPAPPLDALDEKVREECWRLVAAMRREGIYLTLSPYWGVAMPNAGRFGLDGLIEDNGQPGGDAQALLFFDPRLQAAYKQWLRDWLTPPNPHTGIPLAKDPAVAIVQFQNEDSLLFWTMDRLNPKAALVLGKKFGDWLIRKHGSLADARTAWGAGADNPGDDWAGGIPALLPLKFYTADYPEDLARRLADQLEFHARTMCDFNTEIARYLREDLGVGSLFNAGNWRTASTERLNDVERWSYLPAEALAINRYIGGTHLGPYPGYAIQPGDRYSSTSALRQPQDLPVSLRQVAGRPMLVTESTWVLPNLYRAEGPLLVAAYTSLTGVGPYCWFAFFFPEWSTLPIYENLRYRGDTKWSSQTPDTLGLFPAAALLYRRGDVRRGTPVVTETRSLADLWAARPSALPENASFDPNRDTGDSAPDVAATNIPALAYLVGPVHVRYTDDPTEAAVQVADLKPWIDHRAGVVRSNTGEVALDYRHGMLRVDTQRAQGVTGFFRDSGPVRTADAEFTVVNAYAHLLAVSLDDEPLRTSRRILVQLGTVTRPTDWKTKPAHPAEGQGDGESLAEVVAIGGAPWRIEKFSGSVALRNARVTRATVCDPNGLPVTELKLERAGEFVRFTLPSAALYVVLH